VGVQPHGHGQAMTNGEAYPFTPEERALFPGSPNFPFHPPWRRAAYAGVGLLTGVATTFPNALVNVNVSNLAGELGVDVVQLYWLPAIYVAFNATGNLSLVKARTQFGVQRVTRTLLVAYLLAGLLQFLWPTFTAAIVIRAVNGATCAALIALSIYYMQQAFPKKLLPMATLLAISLTQVGIPLARMAPVDVLAAGHWRGLHLLEVAVALAVLAATAAAPLPPSDRAKAFEPLDLVTIALVIPAMLLLSGVLAAGRPLWWTDTPWLGWALAAAVLLFAAAALVEHHRARPLIQTRWISTRTVIRFALVALLVRVALAEQTYNSVGLLTSGGLTNDQLRILFGLVVVAMVLGAVTAALTLSETRLPYLIITSALIIAAAALLDSGANNLTRPPQLYLSQAMIGFGTTLFIGPALVFGLLRVIRRGADHFVTLVVLFSTTQNVGGLAGSALLGTYQTVFARIHAAALSEHLAGADPQVAGRIQGGAASLAGAVADPALRNTQGGGLLAQAVGREANILAYNNTFHFVAALAVLVAAALIYMLVTDGVRARRGAPAEVPA
jgi:hypothetical protein